MRDQKNRLRVNRLFVLGAGASFSATLTSGEETVTTAPLDANFCKRIEALVCQRPGWVEATRAKLIKNWRDHVPFSSFGLEAAIIRHISHLQFFDAIHRRRGRRRALSASEYVDYLAHLITFVLRRCREARGDVFKIFAGIVFPPNRQLDNNGADRVVTFNYDDLFDSHLLSRGFTPQRIYFDQLKNSSEETDRRAAKHAFPLIVKLHGSVNWRCNTHEFQHILNLNESMNKPYRIQQIWLDRKKSPSPDDNASPCIVPPMPNKPITRIKLFRYLWSVACEYLHEARELVICGYSLPETDALALSLSGQLNNSNLQRITVVDPNPAILARWRKLLLRPQVKNVRWEYHADFAEYVQMLSKASPR